MRELKKEEDDESAPTRASPLHQPTPAAAEASS